MVLKLSKMFLEEREREREKITEYGHLKDKNIEMWEK
jgi:hypothetical protein